MKTPFDDFLKLLDDFSDEQKVGAVVGEAMASESCKIAVISGVRGHFMDAQAPDGTPWAPLKRPRPGGTGSDSPLRDTDRLMAATTAVAEGPQITVKNNRRQAALQHYGGTIVPVNVQWLTIPNTLEAKRHRAPDFPGVLHPVFNKGHNAGALVDEDGNVQYWLTKKSVIPARPFIGFSQETISIVLDIVTQRVLRLAMEDTAP